MKVLRPSIEAGDPAPLVAADAFILSVGQPVSAMYTWLTEQRSGKEGTKQRQQRVYQSLEDKVSRSVSRLRANVDVKLLEVT